MAGQMGCPASARYDTFQSAFHRRCRIVHRGDQACGWPDRFSLSWGTLHDPGWSLASFHRCPVGLAAMLFNERRCFDHFCLTKCYGSTRFSGNW